MMPCLHKEAPSSLHVEPRRRSQGSKSGLEKKEKFREKSACVKRKDGEKNQDFMPSTGWIFSTRWTPGVTSQKLGFRFGKENERVKVWLDDHHIRRSSRYWVSDSESFQEVQALQTGPKSRIPFLGRRVSHPVCKPCWRHFHPFALEKPHSCLSTRRFEDSELLNPSCLKCHPHFLSSQRPVEYCERGESCELILRLFDKSSNVQNNIKHLQVLQHFCEILQAQLCSLCLTTTNENGLKSLGPALLTSACTQPEWWRSVMKHVISTGRTLNIRDCYKDPRFQSEIYEKEEVQRPCSILCLPVLNHKTEVLGVVLAVGKSRLNTSECSFFSEQDEKVLSSHMALLGLILENRQLWENSEQECKRNQVLMELAQMVSHDSLVLDTMLSKLARIILPVSKAEFCKVFFSEDSSMGLFTRMVYIEQKNSGPFVEYSRDCDPKDISYIYAVHVRNSQETLNIANSHTNISEVSPIRSLICTPLKDKQSSNIIGVCQLGNKRCESMTDTDVFSQSDEQLLKDFAVYCGLGIQKCTTQQTADKTSARLAVTKEVLSYQITASQEDIHALEEATIPSAQSLHLLDFAFSDFEMSQTSMTQAVLRMFLDLNLLQEFSIDYKTLCQWVLSVRRGYRDTVAYHNWSHAIRTAQCMFAMVQTSDLKGCFSHLEVLALMIASLSHDLDHRGVNNSYIERSKQPLAQLYGHSSLEHHHFDLCLLILNNPGSQILSSLSQQEYRSCVQMIEKNILSTDLAAYLEKRTTFFKLAQNNNCQWMDEQHKELLRSMLMTASDICAITKPWLVQKRIAELVAAEFFAQGDKEKCELDIEPAGLMDRRNATQLPQMQVDYIDGICAPLFEALAGIFESCSPLIEGCRENRKNWQRLAKEEATCRGMESFN